MKWCRQTKVKAEPHSALLPVHDPSIRPSSPPTKEDSAAHTLLPHRVTLPLRSATLTILYVNKREKSVPTFNLQKQNCCFANRAILKQQALPFFRFRPALKKKRKKLMDSGWRNADAITRKCFHPFTPSQWRELEEQAVIFNCMSLGLPIPTHLLLSLRRNRCSQPKLGFFPPYSPLGWGCFQLGSGGRAEDPDPGRCRRTDGKKWRCSRVACPDSKYCERHLHRGKNRLRKRREGSLVNESSVSVLPCSSLSLLPSISISKDTVCEDPWYFHGDKQTSSAGTSGLVLEHCFVLDSDMRLERSVGSEDGGNQKPISLHCFFDDGPERNRIEEDERAQNSQCKSQRRTEDLTSSGSGIPEPLPVLLDLNV